MPGTQPGRGVRGACVQFRVTQCPGAGQDGRRGRRPVHVRQEGVRQHPGRRRRRGRGVGRPATLPLPLGKQIERGRRPRLLRQQGLQETLVAGHQIFDQPVGKQSVDTVELHDHAAVLLEGGYVEPDLRRLAGGVHLRPEQLQGRAVDVGVHVSERAVERVRHPPARRAVAAAGQFTHHLDAGEVPVVQFLAEPRLEGTCPVDEHGPPVHGDLDEHRLAEVADGLEDARVNRRTVRHGGVDGETRTGAPRREGVRVDREQQRRGGESGLGGAGFEHGPRRLGQPREVRREPGVDDRRRTGPQRQVRIGGEIVQPAQPVLARASRGRGCGRPPAPRRTPRRTPPEPGPRRRRHQCRRPCRRRTTSPGRTGTC